MRSVYALMQALEEPEDAVRRLFAEIALDARHRWTRVLLERQIEQRQFPGWAMSFRNLDDPTLLEISGYSDFMNNRLDLEECQNNANVARQLRTSLGR